MTVTILNEEMEGNLYNDPSLSLNFNSSTNDSTNGNETQEIHYISSFGVRLAVPEWEAALTALTLSVIIALTLVGNVLVILSVFTYRPLRSPPNFYIVSLAVADMTVAVFVLPFNVAYSILGRWVLGKILCEFWLTSDIYCCTNSILHLCVIAVDRYRAITDPVNYARKRTMQRVFWMIALVWITSFLISSPPLFGWNDWPEEWGETTICTLTSQKGYVIYSSLGSFFLPLIVMTSVYIRIFIATRRRLRQRARASRLSAMAKQKSVDGAGNKKSEETVDRDRSSISSIENNGNDGQGGPCLQQGTTNLMLKPKKVRKERREKVGTEASCHKVKDETDTTRNVDFIGGHIEPPKTMEDCDNSKLSPANMSEDSVTDAETPLNIKHGNHSTIRDSSHHKSHSGRGSKKSIRQQAQQVCQFVEEKQRISLSKERRAARTLGIIMSAFFFCWAPFFSMYVILPFCESCVHPSPKLVNFITWLGYINSALNPLIYTLFNLDFRKSFKKLLHLDK